MQSKHIFIAGVGIAGILLAVAIFIALPGAIRAHDPHYESGYLHDSYFFSHELKNLDVEIDLDNVPYQADLKLDDLKPACPVRDCLPSIDRPEFERISEQSWLTEDDWVLGIESDGVSKAYPIKILEWHEIVNDRIGNLSIAVTYCPLCASGVVFIRPVIDDELLEFGVSGRLYFSDLVMYDRATATFWSQIEGRPIAGPLVKHEREIELDRLPVNMVQLGIWQDMFPNSLILKRPTKSSPVGGKPARDPDDTTTLLKDYAKTPYPHYDSNDYFMMTTAFTDKRIRSKEKVLGVEIDGFAKAYVLEELDSQFVINDRVGSQDIVLVRLSNSPVRVFLKPRENLDLVIENVKLIDTVTQSEWDVNGTAISGSLQGQQLEEIITTHAFWFAWSIFYPETEIYPPLP